VAAPDEHVVLRAVIGQLPEDRRTAFVLTQVLGLSYAEAAEVCRCPIGTIRSRVARARAELVSAIADEGEAGGDLSSSQLGG
jgi:RNA polymerase sigma-70 factor (ECF subfamily)